MLSSCNLTWSTPNGLHSLKEILHSLIPQWPNGPHPYQLEATAQILDRRKQLVIAACGEGKMGLRRMVHTIFMGHFFLCMVCTMFQGSEHLAKLDKTCQVTHACLLYFTSRASREKVEMRSQETVSSPQ